MKYLILVLFMGLSVSATEPLKSSKQQSGQKFIVTCEYLPKIKKTRNLSLRALSACSFKIKIGNETWQIPIGTDLVSLYNYWKKKLEAK